MANICTGQNQMHIILTRIVRAFNEVFKKDKKYLGTSIFFLCCCTVYIELYDLWPFHEHPLKHKSRFLSTAPVSQKSWVRIPFRPEFFSGFNFTAA